MKTKQLLLLLILIYSSAFSQEKIDCVIHTTMGDIYMELYPNNAPITVENFLKYVDNELYNGTTFFRVCTKENESKRDIQIEVIQGGDVPEDKTYPAIKLETTQLTGIRHTHGTVSMARSEPDSATSSFFICINDQPELDFDGKRNPDGKGFAAFGKVKEGMHVVKKIQAQENENQYLIDTVEIISIEKID